MHGSYNLHLLIIIIIINSGSAYVTLLPLTKRVWGETEVANEEPIFPGITWASDERAYLILVTSTNNSLAKLFS